MNNLLPVIETIAAVVGSFSLALGLTWICLRGFLRTFVR